LTLFESESQYREKATIWRTFSLFPLFPCLAGGHAWRWFAINIPMDLGTGGRFTGEIDIIARLSNRPRSPDWFYRTWEVKVSLLGRDGKARSLKTGKTGKVMNQLRAYREFGAPEVSLLDIVLCEAGCLASNPFPTPEVFDVVAKKLPELRDERFGYHLLPFEHGRDADGDVGLISTNQKDLPGRRDHPMLGRPDFYLLEAAVTNAGEGFMRLAQRLDQFFEAAAPRPAKSSHQIVFCRECRQLQLIRMRDDEACPTCGADLIAQS
jgi:hypothetical protein